MTLIRPLMLALLLLASVVVTFAQSEQPGKSPAPDSTVTVSISAKAVRFAALSNIAQIRLEVFNANGDALYNSEFQAGNFRDWALEDKLGQRLPDGSYLCVVTVRDVSGRLSIKQGTISVLGGQGALKLGEGEQAGAVEPEKSLSPVSEGNSTAVTLMAHNGTDGQLVSTRGGMSFRAGDFFAGQDRELMRLTPEGNLGIGITNPQVRLDVDGVIRASQGVVFPDGSIQYSAATRTFGAKSSQPGVSLQSIKPGKNSSGGQEHIDAAGTGTQNFIAKWTETGGAGTLGNSGILETAAGNVGIGTTSPANKLDIVRGAAGLMPKGVYETASFEFNSDAKFGVYSSAASAPSAALTFGSTNLQVNSRFPGFELQYIYGATAAANQTRFNYIERNASGTVVNFAANVLTINGDGSVTLNPITSGVTASPRLGIGTNSPQAQLDVTGDVLVSGNIAAKYQDVAEWVPATQKLAAGTVVSLDVKRSNTVTPSARAYDTHIAGVVSAQPGVTLGQGGDGKLLVATVGRVKVKVDASRHSIKIGDLLVTSDKSGVAMKSQPVRVAGTLIHRPGTIIGKALEPLTQGQGEILVLLSLQ